MPPFPYHPELPLLTTEQMIEVDRAMMHDYRIELIQMMENAGRNLAHLARVRFLDGDPRGKEVIVLAGTGGNGGGAMVAARRLHNWGAKVSVFVSRQPEKAVPSHQLNILEKMKLDLHLGTIPHPRQSAALVLDGVIGYSLNGNPRGNSGDLIQWTEGHPAPVLSLDTPSGIDLTSGMVFHPVVKAVATMTLAMPKKGLLAEHTRELVGELYLADISVPPGLFQGPELDFQPGPIFAQSEIIRIR
jgi:NAD(P)H-hydrate epimerase